MTRAIPEAEADLLTRTTRSIVDAGPVLSGSERRAVAERSRFHAAEQSLDPPTDTHDELVWRFTNAAHTIRASWPGSMAEAGVSSERYVEVLGIVARLRAIDTFSFAVGAPPPELPESDDATPTGRVAGSASIDGGWVPTVGRAQAPTALSLLPSEHQAMHDLHGVFYLSIEEMSDLDAHRGLHRAQMELVASRTSLLNECFY